MPAPWRESLLRNTFARLPAEGAIKRSRRERRRPQAALKPCYGDDRRPTEQPRWAGNPGRRKTGNREAQTQAHGQSCESARFAVRRDAFRKTLQSRERTMIKVSIHE